MVDDDDTIAEAFGLLHVVRGIEQSLAPVFEDLEVIEDRIPALWVNPNGGLVQKQDLRVVQERSGQSYNTYSVLVNRKWSK